MSVEGALVEEGLRLAKRKRERGRERGRKRESQSLAVEPPFIFQRYREWLPRFFTKLIECSLPLRTARQLPVELSSVGPIGAPSLVADNIKSAPIWQNSRSVMALIRCTLPAVVSPDLFTLSPPCSSLRSRISPITFHPPPSLFPILLLLYSVWSIRFCLPSFM